jgi:uncharacterized membrane protein
MNDGSVIVAGEAASCVVEAAYITATYTCAASSGVADVGGCIIAPVGMLNLMFPSCFGCPCMLLLMATQTTRLVGLIMCTERAAFLLASENTAVDEEIGRSYVRGVAGSRTTPQTF